MSSEMELSEFRKKPKPANKAKSVTKPTKTKDAPAKKVKVKSKPVSKKPVKRVKPVSKKKLIPSKKELKALKGTSLEIVGHHAVEVMQSTVFDKNREQADQYESMFYQLVNIKDIAEKKYLESKQSKDIYALMKVYDQMREVIADMKALQDVGDYIFSIDEEVLRPLLTQSGQALLEIVRNVVEFSNKNLGSDDAAAISAFVKRQGKAAGYHLQDAYRSGMENTRKILVG